jgi:hypothetical protein
VPEVGSFAHRRAPHGVRPCADGQLSV